MGSYELLELLGRGGMGTVYRGRHGETGAIVAVKVMAKELAADPVLLKRFEQEFLIARRLRHPNMVQGFSFGVEDGKPFLVMEFVEGRNLGRLVKDSGPLSEAEAVRVILQVADALELAHREKLIHRDVKPENILLTPDGQAKLTDLGLIKDMDSGSELTRTRTTLGTAAFMAPEQFEDAKRVDVRSDVYGLAATLYFILTGVVPFQGRGNLTIMSKKLKNDFLPLRHIVPNLRVHIDKAICQALNADADQRPRSCADFVALLTRTPDGIELDSEPAPPRVGRPEVLPPAEERRIATRHPVALDASCSPLQGGLQQWRAEILDISLTGTHLQLDRRFEAGAVLRVEVLDEGLGVLATWLVRVRWVREVTPRRWSIGCAFNRELSEAELDAFLGALPPTVVVKERK